jgi:hypothetical protein
MKPNTLEYAITMVLFQTQIKKEREKERKKDNTPKLFDITHFFHLLVCTLLFPTLKVLRYLAHYYPIMLLTKLHTMQLTVMLHCAWYCATITVRDKGCG